jgi:DNA-binding transcriptional regulator YiaG
MTKKRNKSRILSEVHEAARDLRKAGVMDATTMHRFDKLCLPRTPRRARSVGPTKRTSENNVQP